MHYVVGGVVILNDVNAVAPRAKVSAIVGSGEEHTGIIFLPEAMVGMIIAGADLLEAVRLQIVVLHMLLGSVSIAAITTALISYRAFFSPRHQLRTESAQGSP